MSVDETIFVHFQHYSTEAQVIFHVFSRARTLFGYRKWRTRHRHSIKNSYLLLSSKVVTRTSDLFLQEVLDHFGLRWIYPTQIHNYQTCSWPKRVTHFRYHFWGVWKTSLGFQEYVLGECMSLFTFRTKQLSVFVQKHHLWTTASVQSLALSSISIWSKAFAEPWGQFLIGKV